MAAIDIYEAFKDVGTVKRMLLRPLTTYPTEETSQEEIRGYYVPKAAGVITEANVVNDEARCPMIRVSAFGTVSNPNAAGSSIDIVGVAVTLDDEVLLVAPLSPPVRFAAGVASIAVSFAASIVKYEGR